MKKKKSVMRIKVWMHLKVDPEECGVGYVFVVSFFLFSKEQGALPFANWCFWDSYKCLSHADSGQHNINLEPSTSLILRLASIKLLSFGGTLFLFFLFNISFQSFTS